MSEGEAKAAVQAQFAASAEAYVKSPVHAKGADLRRLVELAKLQGDEIVLDIATGGGHMALAFAPYVREVVATDLTPAMLAAAERFITAEGIKNVRFEFADAEALPFPDLSFDIVTCRVAPHHFGDIGLFVREVARVLRPGGKFVLADTISPSDANLDQFINTVEKLRDATHVREYTVDEWRSVCAAAGLAVAHAETFEKTIAFDDWCVRARVTPAVQAELVATFAAATAAEQEAFHIEFEDGRVRQFILYSVLLVAHTL